MRFLLKQYSFAFFCLVLLQLVVSQPMLKAQIPSVDGFNYYDINHNAFLTNFDCNTISSAENIERNYFHTVLGLAQELNRVFLNTAQEVDTVVGAYRISKRQFFDRPIANDRYRWVLIRPNDDVVRPTVIITHGAATSGASIKRTTSFGVTDYVQRGYAVVYYQSGPIAGDSIGMQTLIDAGIDSTQCGYNWSPAEDVSCFQQAVYFKTQAAVAANQFTAANAATFNLDPNAFFASGFSGGGIGTLYGVMADETTFSNALFDDMGPLDSLSMFPEATVDIKAVSSLAGGVVAAGTEDFRINTLIDPSDNDTRFLLFHGQDDFAVRPGTAPLIWSDPAGELPGSSISCALDISPMMAAAGISHKVVINCSGCHDVYTYPCESGEDGVSNNPEYIGDIPQCVLWQLPGVLNPLSNNPEACPEEDTDIVASVYYVLMQVHDYARLSAYYFHEDFPDSGPLAQIDDFTADVLSESRLSAVNPKVFPFIPENGYQNGHWEKSTKCYQDECSTLLFDKQGLGDEMYIVGVVTRELAGDCVNIPADQLNIFNENFTLEMSVKTIKDFGKSVLFSSVNRDVPNAPKGFEVFIDGEGFLNFHKAIGETVFITGDVNVRDGYCHNLALIREGNLFSLYLDTVRQGTPIEIDVNFPTVANIRLGNSNRHKNNNQGFNGIIRYARMWEAAISPTEFDQQDLPSSTVGLKADWLFNGDIEQSVIASNGLFPATLGNDESNVNYDPRWVKNDTICNCPIRPTPVSTPTVLFLPDLKAFPNPSNGLIKISGFGVGQEKKSYAIFDVQGRRITSGVLYGDQKQIFLEESGVYFLRINAGKRIYTKRLFVH